MLARTHAGTGLTAASGLAVSTRAIMVNAASSVNAEKMTNRLKCFRCVLVISSLSFRDIVAELPDLSSAAS